MTTPEGQSRGFTDIDEYRNFVVGRLGLDGAKSDEVDAALRFRVWNGDFDGEVDRTASPQILGELGIDKNIIYRSLE